MGGICSNIGGPKPYRNQKYLKIRKHYIKLGHNIYFKDLKFPASDSILTVGSDIPRNIEWKRPSDVCDLPTFLVGLLGQHGVRPGLLSQQWIVSAFALLAARTELWHWVVPQYRVQCWGEQPKSHPGVFHFRLWYRGTWVDVVIDDLLPFLDGQLVGAQSTCSTEWWPALLEKAYAKLLGSYAALKSVRLADVLVDLTGGVSELWTLPSPSSIQGQNGQGGEGAEESYWPLFQKLKTELMHQSLVTAWVKEEVEEEGCSDRTTLGLKLGQPYLVLSAKKICLESSTLKGIVKGKEKIGMVRLCSPGETTQPSPSLDAPQKQGMGDAGEGNAAFVFSHSHLSRMLSKVPDWSRLSDAEKQKLGLTVSDNREFWMPAEDFLGQFSTLCVCRLLSSSGAPPLSCGGTGDSDQWHEASVRGSWKSSTVGATSSGRSTPSQSLLCNPQFLMDVPGDKGADVVFQLLQWSAKSTQEDDNYPAISFTVLKVEENRKYRLHSLLGHCPSVLNVSDTRCREVNARGHLQRGRYLVVPHAERESLPPSQFSSTNNFLLRCFSHETSYLRAISLDVPPKHWWNCFTKEVACVTVVTVKSAEGLWHHSRFFGCDAYCELVCEGGKVRTRVVKNNTEPTWEQSFVFYRRQPSRPLLARVLNHRALAPSQLIGQAQMPAPVNHQPSLLRADLLLPGREDEVSRGVIVLELTTEDDLNAL